MGWREDLRASLKESFRDFPAELLHRLGGGALLIAILALYDVWLWESDLFFPMPWPLVVAGVGIALLLVSGRLRREAEPFDRDPLLWLGPVGLLGALIVLVGIWIWGWDVAESLWVAGTAGPLGALLVLRSRRMEQIAKQGHVASVYYVTVPGEEPYYVAICECGWLGDIHSPQELAFEDARRHTSAVQAEIQFRP